MGLERIGEEALSLLKNKTLGGVSKESAIEAINKVVEAAQKEIGKVQAEVAQFKGKTAEEMAALTTAKDSLSLRLKNVKKGRTVKTELPNGNTKTRQVNQNGTVMEKIVSPNGNLIEAKVELLSGEVRHTKYNPKTNKPVSTYSDTTGKQVLIKYDDTGKSITSQKVNNKKVESDKPFIVNKVNTEDHNLVYLSDGTIKEYRNNKGKVQIRHWSSDSKVDANSGWIYQGKVINMREETKYYTATKKGNQVEVRYTNEGIEPNSYNNYNPVTSFSYECSYNLDNLKDLKELKKLNIKYADGTRLKFHPESDRFGHKTNNCIITKISKDGTKEVKIIPYERLKIEYGVIKEDMGYYRDGLPVITEHFKLPSMSSYLYGGGIFQ